MSFGRCPSTGKTFAEKFPPSVYETLPLPSGHVTGNVQFQRALAIEAAFVDCTDESSAWKQDSKRYLFFMLNEMPDGNCRQPGRCIGGFHAFPNHVRECVFLSEHYPASFRWFVVDPTAKEEVAFMASQMYEFWHIVAGQKDQWWHKLLHSHGLSEESE